MTRSLDQWLETAVGGRWAFIGLGIVLILGGVGGSLYESLRSADRPILRYPSAIAVADDGEIYVYSERSRIRVFSQHGTQLRSWSVHSANGVAAIRLEPSGGLAVATPRNQRLHLFSKDGKLISSKLDRGALERIGPRNRDRAIGKDGSTYEIVDMAIVRVTGRGEREVVVAGVPLALRVFFLGRIPPITFALVGIASLAVGVALVAQHQQRGHSSRHEVV